MLSLTKLIIIALIVFAVFGAGRLPKVMGDLGRGLRSFKDGLNDGEDEPKTDIPRDTARLQGQTADTLSPAERLAADRDPHV